MSDRTALLKRFSTLEDQRNTLLQRLSGEDAERLARSPRSGTWSVAQVLLHLAIAEEGLMNYVDLKLRVGGHGPVGIDARFRLALLNTALALPIKFKAPAVVANVPECTFDEATLRWGTARQRMHLTFTSIPEALIRHGLIKHPTAGKFDLVRGIGFIGWHVRHHLPQIERTLRTVR
jgi:hypothetical protein